MTDATTRQAIEIGDPRPDCHLRLTAGEVDVNLGVSSITEITGVLPTWDALAKEVWEQNRLLELNELPGMDKAALAELDEALTKAAAPFLPVIRQAVTAYLAMIQAEYRELLAEQARKPVPVLVVHHPDGSITSPWPEES